MAFFSGIDKVATAVADAPPPAPAPTLEQLANLYQTELGRAPDIGGLQYWSSQKGSYDDIASAFRAAAANEIAARPAVTSEAIAQLYQTELGRAPDAAGAAYWQNYMKDRIDPNEVAAFQAEARKEIAARLATANQPGVSRADYDRVMGEVKTLQDQIANMGRGNVPVTSGSGIRPGPEAIPGVNMNYAQPVIGKGAEIAAPAYAPPVTLPTWAQRPDLKVGGASVLGALPPPVDTGGMLDPYLQELARRRAAAALQPNPLSDQLNAAYNPADATVPPPPMWPYRMPGGG